MNKKIRIGLLALILIFTLVLTGCFGNNGENEDYNGNEVIAEGIRLLEGFEKFETEYFEIQFNSDWTKEVTEDEGVMFLSPEGTSVVSVLMEHLPEMFDITQYKDLSIQNAKTMHGEDIGEVLEQRTIVNGLEAYGINYEFINEYGMPVDIIQVLILDETGKVSFVITFSGTNEARQVYFNMLSTFVIR